MGIINDAVAVLGRSRNHRTGCKVWRNCDWWGPSRRFRWQSNLDGFKHELECHWDEPRTRARAEALTARMRPKYEVVEIPNARERSLQPPPEPSRVTVRMPNRGEMTPEMREQLDALVMRAQQRPGGDAAAHRRLDSFAALQPGWGEDEGKAISAESVANARTFFDLLSVSPSMFADPDGFVRFEWIAGNKVASVEFNPENENSGVFCLDLDH